MTEPARRTAQHEPLLDYFSLDHRHGAVRDVVVVKARVVAVDPRDHPHVDVAVAPQLFEVSLGGVEAHEPPPPVPVGGDLSHELP